MTDVPAGAVPPFRTPARLNFPAEVDLTDFTDTQSLIANDVDDEALAALAPLTHLAELRIMGSFTDEGLLHLAGLDKLEQLTLSSPNITGRGFRHLTGMTALQSLRLENCGLTPKGARAATNVFVELSSLKLEGPTISVEHMLMLRPMPKLESLRVAGGGDFLGSAEGEIDRATAVRFVAGCPELQRVSVRWWNGNSMVGDATLTAMLEARPGLTVNDTWYDPIVFELPRPERSQVNGSAGDEGADPAEIGVVNLTEEDFDASVRGAPVALIQTWSSNPNICQAFGVTVGSVEVSLEQLAPLLAGQVLVGRVDEYTSEELAEQLRDRCAAHVGTLLVFRQGEFVGRLGAHNALSILAQLAPVLPQP